MRCDKCLLVQFRTNNNECRRCKTSLDEDEPVAVFVEPPPPPKAELGSNGLGVARAIRCLRQRAGLSQRQLALRMQVPRTYVSKIENDKAMPTLSSMDRLARALGVGMADLLAGGELTATERARELLTDPFLATMMPDLLRLDSMQRASLVAEMRALSMRSRRSA